jgi:transcriptional regulator with XRE-family HTH domain
MQGRDLIAWNVRRLRVSRDMSQERLAGEAGLERRFVGAIERAEENPSIQTLEQLAHALGVHVSVLLAEPIKGEPAPRPLRAGRKKKLTGPGSSNKR